MQLLAIQGVEDALKEVIMMIKTVLNVEQTKVIISLEIYLIIVIQEKKQLKKEHIM